MMWLIGLFTILLAPVVYLFLDWLVRSLKIDDHGNKFIIITGCDSGFGQALALRLDKMQFHVFAGCLTEDGEDFLATHASEKLKSFRLDVSSQESVQKALLFVKGNLPPKKGIWALVNNAGVAGETGPPELNTVKGYKKALDVNLFGPIEMCHTFLPLIRPSRGRIVNMTSVAGRIAGAEGPYCASKFGFEGYSDVLRRELYHQGVHVCILEPGFFKTNILNPDNLIKDVFERMKNADEETKATYGKNFNRNFSLKVKAAINLAETNLDPVVDTYVHAITSRFPRTRYVVGTVARFVFIPSSYLPDFILNIAFPLSQKFIK